MGVAAVVGEADLRSRQIGSLAAVDEADAVGAASILTQQWW